MPSATLNFERLLGAVKDAVEMRAARCKSQQGNTPALRAHAAAIAARAVGHRLPTIGAPWFAEAGLLLGYGPSVEDMYRRAAYFVDKILEGANPVDLPNEQPTKFELVINLKTAKALGLTIPQSLLVRADEIIQ